MTHYYHTKEQIFCLLIYSYNLKNLSFKKTLLYFNFFDI